jgi:hypothetical protein
VDTPDPLTGDLVLLAGWGLRAVSKGDLVENVDDLKFINLKASKKCEKK